MSITKVQKILIVEDDRTLSHLYQTKLEKTGYQVAIALDGEEGLKQIADFKPDAILLDIIIPKIDGFSVLERLKEEPGTKNIPVILLTNLGQDEDVEKGKALGADDYLIKSNFTPTEIVKKLEEVISNKKSK
ncbi:MAG: hypothetical protein A2445_03240 [Candidatus Jacksonbacteria bacterium RIFOXYC2_FULL_44_29]|nr:MAG: Two component transcriptional regulator PhoB, winged helix family [Parcubacteria group bacterium GW2011_GWC2_44_22]OGY78348.1 MAG: hypothetical protein A2550_00325 [Candidatus Jacksonbacteria bacterium RIFOXYD2_FULL_43_21]OGY79813.1 MAG: hypothetical protein A2445_03240 [Candidatus Jacksonbacteria bacterium RIFOXYC2_FULL_44_29]HCE49071.1 response regulator [Candidatus Jacksonbacteria bacterium]